VRALITGGEGFVGRHLARHLAACGDEVVVVDLDCDVTQGEQVRSVVSEAVPEVIYHLAALAHVGDSWNDPARVLEVNVIGTAHVLAAARSLTAPCAVIVASSAEVYGSVTPEDLPLREDRLPAPASPYAASKAAAEQISLQAARGFSQRVIVARPFNHIGPGQAPSFAVPAFAQRILSARASGATSLLVGNLSVRRDFTDVRDVVAAYRLLALHGVSGEIYNIASGQDVSMEEVVARLQELAGTSLALVPDDDLMRPLDIPVLRGDSEKLRTATGWQPAYDLNASLAAVLDEVTS